MADGTHSTIRSQTLELKGRVLFRSLFPLGATISAPDGFEFEAMTPDGIVGEMNVAICGQWMGHPAGPFAMDADKMQQCCDRFEQQHNPMLVDYEHNSMGGGDGRAAGWIHRLTVRGSGDGAQLWATVEWTARAAEMIKSGEYRYCSPVIDFGAKDRETGEHVPVELFNVAITNNPFLDGMHPIALSRVAAAAAPPEDATDPEAEAETESEPGATVEIEVQPGVGGDAAEQGGEEANAAGDASEESPLTPPEEAPPPSPEETVAGQLSAFVDAVMSTSGGSKAAVLDALNELSDQVGGLVRNRLDTTDGSASDAQEIPMTDKPNQQQAANTDAPQGEMSAVLSAVGALAKQVGDLRATVEADKQARIEASRKTAEDDKARLEQQNAARIDAMMGDGRLAEDERDVARLLLSQNAELFEGIYGKRVAGSASPVGRRQTASTTAHATEADEESAEDSAAAASDGNKQRAALARAVEGLTAAEKRTFEAFRRMGKDPAATVRRILNARQKAADRVGGTAN